MTWTLAIETLNGREHAALLKDNALLDLVLDPDKDLRTSPGAIHNAKLLRRLPGFGGTFLALQGGQQAFLRHSYEAVTPHGLLPVQIIGCAQGNKATPVTASLRIKNCLAVATPGKPGRHLSRAIRDKRRRGELNALMQGAAPAHDASIGLILRTACEDSSNEEITEAMAEVMQCASAVQRRLAVGRTELLLEGWKASAVMRNLWPECRHARLATGPGALEDLGVWDRIEQMLAPVVGLRGGGSVCIENTQALVAIDINTGSDTTKRAGLKANLEAIRALPALLRIRGVGGQIVVDPAPMPKKDRRLLEAAINDSIKGDPIPTRFVGWTALGHLEFQRRNERKPLLVTDLPQHGMPAEAST